MAKTSFSGQEDRSVLIRRCKLWADLREEEYEELDVLDAFKEAKKGEYIYFEAFHHNIIYFIKQGHIRIGRINDDGTEQTKDILNPGDFFGQFTLEKNNLNGEFAQVIKSDISLCSFTIDNFLYLLKQKPQISIKYSKLVGLKFRKFENRLLNIMQKDVRTRLLLFLEELLQDAIASGKTLRPGAGFTKTGNSGKADTGKGLTGGAGSHGERAGTGDIVYPEDRVVIPNYLTHEEVGQLTGSARQTVTTQLNALKEEGIVIFSRREIEFLQVSKNFRTRQ